jgi:hypothetical protein
MEFEMELPMEVQSEEVVPIEFEMNPWRSSQRRHRL